MTQKNDFEVTISSEIPVPDLIVQNIAELLFSPLPQRDEQSLIILSHVDDTYIEVSLERLRYVLSSLYEEFQRKNIQPGDTVLLATLSVNTELYTILLLAGLVSYGARVFFPMFVETTELDNWIQKTDCSTVIFPETEIQGLFGHERQKQVMRDIRTIAERHHLTLYDTSEDFHLFTSLTTLMPKQDYLKNTFVSSCIRGTSIITESMIFTTSGTSGRSKLVLYEQGAFLRNCSCWQASGLYQKEKLGGRSFLDIMTHTVSIRALFNAFWTGCPVCIVRTDWIKQKPQKIFPILVKMKPQVMTLGPAAFKVILELTALAPEIKELAFSELRTVVSTGAPYSATIAEEMKKQLDLPLHNAYGLTETQQVLTTLLSDSAPKDPGWIDLGKPIAGVTIGLKQYDNDLFSLYVSSPFGHKKILNEQTGPLHEFFYSGDIVKYRTSDGLTYVGREKKDFIKSGYGAKVPISYLQEYYTQLYQEVNHIEYMAFETFNFSLGIAALLFITDTRLPSGRITDKKTIQKYYHLIKKINRDLLQRLEPFEYEQRAIARFLLVNNPVDYTHKGTVSGFFIDMQFSAEKNDLIHSNNPKTGVKNMQHLSSVILRLLLHHTPLRQKFIRRFILRIILH